MVSRLLGFQSETDAQPLLGPGVAVARLEVEKDGNLGEYPQSFLPFSPNAETNSNLCCLQPAQFTPLSDNLLDAQKLIFRSVIQRNDDITYWIERVNPDIVQPILKGYLVGDDVIEPQPIAALTALGSLPQREPFIEELCSLLQNSSLPTESRYQVAMYLAEIKPQLALETLRHSSILPPPERQQALIYLYNAQASGLVTLGQRPTWLEHKAIVSSRLRTNAGYMAARAGTAGLAAMIGGLLGSLAGFGVISGYYYLYLFGAIFVPFVWAASLMLGLSLMEALRFNRRPSTWLAGAVLGNLPLAFVAAADPSPNLARLGLISGLLGAVLSGCIFAGTLILAGQLTSTRWRVPFSITGAALAGLTNGLILAPLATTTGIPGFNQWILAVILAGGAASMMLGLILVPALPFVGMDQRHGLELKDMFYKKEARHVA